MSIRAEVLDCLESHRGRDVSGQEIADRLGVSRNAVWKAIASLREEGYSIESRSRRGYRLAEDNDILSEEGIRASLTEYARDMPIIVFDEVDSTNNEAKRMLASGFDGTCLVVASRQSGGRGRRGRRFFSPKGGVYMSMVMQNESDSAQAVMMTMAAAVAVARAVERWSGVVAQIKWVNDVFVEGKKVSGILTEGISDLETGSIQSVVVGIGINVGDAKSAGVPDELRDVMGFVKPGKGLTRNSLIADVANELISLRTVRAGSEASGAPVFIEEYRSRSLVVGRHVDCVSGAKSFGAFVESIADDGSLVVTTDDGERRVVRDGEVSLRMR